MSIFALISQFSIVDKVEQTCKGKYKSGYWVSILISAQLQDEKLIKQLRDEKIDFAFSAFMDLCGFLIFEKVGIGRHAIVVASAMPMIMSSAFGLPNSGSYVPG